MAYIKHDANYNKYREHSISGTILSPLHVASQSLNNINNTAIPIL